MEILTCSEYDEKEGLETFADYLLTPSRYLFDGKTIHLIDQRIVRTSRPDWSLALAIAAFAVTVITGTFLFAAVVKWALPQLKILPNPIVVIEEPQMNQPEEDRWDKVMEVLNLLGEYPSAEDFLYGLEILDDYCKDNALKDALAIQILSRCKDPQFLIRNALIRRINTLKIIPPIESIFAEKFVPSFRTMIIEKGETVVIN